MQKVRYQGKEGFAFWNDNGTFFLYNGEAIPVDNPEEIEVIPVQTGNKVYIINDVDSDVSPTSPQRGIALNQWGGRYQWYVQVGEKVIKANVSLL
jgi:hypothetical protein